MLSAGTGALPDVLAPLHRALTAVERPDTVITWMNLPKVATLLTELGRHDRPLTHEALDELPQDKTLAHLRSVLVAVGVLPARDERLHQLQTWITTLIEDRAPTDRPILHGWAIWHQLRRLRRRLGAAHANQEDTRNIRRHVLAAVTVLDLAAAEQLTLATLTQNVLDRWAAEGHLTYPKETAGFIRWAVTHRHAHDVVFTEPRWGGPAGPHDTEQRWAQAHRLLHDTSLQLSDRVAGLLMLLYAQPAADIAPLTTDHVHDTGTQVTITFGTVPVVLPEPLDHIVRDLVATRRGHATIGRPDTTPWLFPGGRPGQPLAAKRLNVRLQNIGLQPRQARTTSLFALAADLPAAIVARTLGIHIRSAVTWQKAAAGDWMTYAADISRRPHPQ